MRLILPIKGSEKMRADKMASGRGMPRGRTIGCLFCFFQRKAGAT